jgi:hypothetical protein
LDVLGAGSGSICPSDLHPTKGTGAVCANAEQVRPTDNRKIDKLSPPIVMKFTFPKEGIFDLNGVHEDHFQFE